MQTPFSFLAGGGSQVIEVSGFLTSDDEGGPTYAFTDISGTGTEITNFTAFGDDWDDQDDITPGFTFPFFGTNYTTFWITSDGCVAFVFDDDSRVVYNDPGFGVDFPDSYYLDHPIICVWAKQIMTIAARPSGVFWKVDGDHLTIQWDAMDTNDAAGGTGSTFTFQCILFDTGKIQFVYETMTPVTDDLKAAIGLQKDATHNGITVSDGDTLVVSSNFMVEFT